LRVDAGWDLTASQLRVADHAGGSALVVSGPPGAGKTSALAARALRLAAAGKKIAVVCSHVSSCSAFRAVLALGGDAEDRVTVDTLAGHLASWMRADFVSSGASPDLIVGSDADSRALALSAGASILDMSWPGFRSIEFTLDLPFLGSPERFFDEAASLFRQMRRWRVAPDEFEARCAAGLSEFYGADVERARVLCAEREVKARASSRGRAALFTDVAKLRTQKRAERELGILLGYLYREYRAAARSARVLCVEDVVDEGIGWLERDAGARARVASALGALLVDDAEDAEPATSLLVELLRGEGLRDVTIASCDSSAIDGIGGRRALSLDGETQRIDLAPLSNAAAEQSASRFKDERAEADAIASSIGDLLTSGAARGDVMVLARDEGAAAVYARLLLERGIPITASPAAWQSPKDVEDFLALACIVDDPYDHAHLLRVLASPLVGLSDQSLLTLCRDAAGAGQLALDVGISDARVDGARGAASTTLAENALYGKADLKLSAHARESLVAFRQRWSEWQKTCVGLSAPASMALLLEASGFKAAWHNAATFLRDRLARDGERLVEAATRLGAASLGETARRLEAGFGSVSPAPDTPDAISCRSILGSKGRRAAYVFVAGVAHERFPRIYVSRAMAYSKKYGLIVRENVAGGAAQSAKFAWYYAKFGAKARYLDEERRALAYALSRADRAAFASGFGKPPRWAADQDLLAAYGA
jgi:superfamily I DNA/RNA helicase